MDESVEVRPPATSAFDAASRAASSQLLSADLQSSTPASRATSPGTPSESVDESDKRYRPRTFSYFRLLPFDVEEEPYRDAALAGILRKLYTAVKAEDFAPGALHWTRELQGWLSLKFEMTRDLRIRLARLYYHLCLAPGLESATAERFSRMLITLTSKKQYIKPVDDLTLDWRPLWKEFKGLVLPSELAQHQSSRRSFQKHLLKLCLHVNAYFDPAERRHMLDEFLPYFSTGDLTNAYVVVGALNLFFPTTAPPPPPVTAATAAAAAEAAAVPLSQPADFTPTLFHLWSLVARSKSFDAAFIDILSRLARDYLHCDRVPFGAHGIFTEEQSRHVFTAILRLTEIPVGQGASPYSSLDSSRGVGVFLEKDRRKYPVPYTISRFIVHSLSPACLLQEKEEEEEEQGGSDASSSSSSSVLSLMEGLIQSIDTFFHPSNQGNWTHFLAQLTFSLTDIFVSRWNREQSGELEVPEARRITPALRRRFVLALRDVVFMGIFAKSSKVVTYYYSALQGLAFLEPGLILPGALQRFYPGLQGLVEVHRTTASLCSLQMIANVMSQHKGYRCHITALLAYALPGIDANDLGKTQHTLNFIESVAYSIPFVPLAKKKGAGGRRDGRGGANGDDDEDDHFLLPDTSLAMEWVNAEMERMERAGQGVALDYDTELDDALEADILRSSTAGFGEFVLALLGKVFTLLENLPDPSHVRTSSPEEAVINTLPAALTPLFATLSPDVFDTVLDKLATFVSTHVVHQARDAMAWICNALCKADPRKTLRVFLPMLLVNIRNEIDYNGAASDRSSGTEVLPRDRALVWHVSILSMCVVHVGAEVLAYRDDLLGIARYMQDKCRGLPTIHISNYVHHLLINLTNTYPLDNALYEPEVLARGLDVDDWGRATPPAELTVRWHRPSPAEIDFALELFEGEATSASRKLEALMSDDPPVSRKGKNKEWSDELSRSLTALRLVISGVSTLFDPRRASGRDPSGSGYDGVVASSRRTNADHEGDDMVVDGGGGPDDVADADADAVAEEDVEPLAEAADTEELERQFHYPAGYLLDPRSELFARVHDLREQIGYLLSRTHAFLTAHQEDDVGCFTALYNAYRNWITDVGIERSAHPLERVQRLYRADIAPFKISGLRKAYPRPLLVKRADAYQLQRVKYNATYRKMSPLDRRLLLDLAESCVSPYADVRRIAQGAQDSSLKVLIGGRTLVIPALLRRFAEALERNDHDRIKGALYSLIYSPLLKTLLRDWRFAPTFMQLYIGASGVDKQSVQELCTHSVGYLRDFGRPLENLVVTDPAVVDAIAPPATQSCAAAIERRRAFIRERRTKVEAAKQALGRDLTRLAASSHWKIAYTCIIFAANLNIRFDTLAPPSFVELVVRGANDPHPDLRGRYRSALSNLFTYINMRAVYAHSYERYLLEDDVDDNKFKVAVPRDVDAAAWTRRYLDAFGRFDDVEYYVDNDFPGWLVWGREFTALRADPRPFEGYDAAEDAIRSQIGRLVTREWLREHFAFLKQEPREASSDRFRIHNVILLMQIFDLMYYGKTAVTFDEVKELVRDVYGDGSDKHQHRATAEILGALLAGSCDEPRAFRDETWGFAAPLVLRIMADELTPDNLHYWITCLHLTVDTKDPRRSKEFVQALVRFRLDMSSNAAFKEASKVQLLEILINGAGWHFRHEAPILEDFLAHIDHPYKSVREAIGRTIASIFRTRYHESFGDVATLLARNREASSLGLRPYAPSGEFAAAVGDAFARLARWRGERAPGQQTQSSYTSGAKTVLTWLDNTIHSQECAQLARFLPAPIMDELLHMMDVKEDPELMGHAYQVYRQMANVPFRDAGDGDGEDEADAFAGALIRVGRSAKSWHQRLRALVAMQVLYFRRLFLARRAQRQQLFAAVGDMLADAQLEVRDTARATLAGMIRCSPEAVRAPVLAELKARFEAQLLANPMPPRRRLPGGGGGASASGTETPVEEEQRQVARRHAAVLGLGALIEAFPYASPPPAWMPEVLALLATRAASDRGIVGKAAKGILSDFKKTRQDTWSVDQKYFTSEQLEDLEGVLWKSYFA